MKKLLIAVVLPLFLFAGCSNLLEKKTSNYKEKVSKITADYLTESTRMQMKGVPAEEIQPLYEKAVSDIKEVSLKTIRKNRNNTLAVVALKDVIYMLDKEELETVLASLGPKIQQDEFIVRVMSGELEEAE